VQNEFESATQKAQKSGAKANVGARAVRDRMRRTAEDVQEQFASAAESTKERICAAAVSVKKRARAASANSLSRSSARRSRSIFFACADDQNCLIGQSPQARSSSSTSRAVLTVFYGG
jgi:isochorismate synthase EntC